ncbi:MAG: PhzF family phenazine biosynthesis protein, partial [Pseudomonadota bacterium]
TSRFFAPGSGIPEDPATGSWHCLISPLAADVSGKTEISCFQAYPGRGAQIETALMGDRVKVRGRSVTVIEGQFRL